MFDFAWFSPFRMNSPSLMKSRSFSLLWTLTTHVHHSGLTYYANKYSFLTRVPPRQDEAGRRGCSD